VKTLGTTTLNSASNRYTATQLGGTRYQVMLAQAQAASADLDGSAIPTQTSTYQYDAYNNATQIVVAATDGFSKTTSNTYTNDTTNWYLGRLAGATVTSTITSPGSPPAQQPVNVVISSSTNNLNLWNYLLAIGEAKAGTAGAWAVTIASGVTISSNSSSTPALDTGTFPSGSSLTLINNGTIVGAGGAGGVITYQFVCCDGDGNQYQAPVSNPGAAGGTAFRAQVALSLTNNGSIWGGGGGGGAVCGTLPGGGGAGLIPGSGSPPAASGTLSSGGAGTSQTYDDGNGGTFTCTSGSGGNAGQPGGNGTGGTGGAAGSAAAGNSLITWVTVGDRRGPLN
jgi:hypothetical protein